MIPAEKYRLPGSASHPKTGTLGPTPAACLPPTRKYEKGSYSVSINGASLRNGLYIATVTMNNRVVSKKTLKLR
ncbi:MAG: hypothetical protein H7Z75_23195 [Ferruginibacter sp.]|nr:hypothetical protein [Cytophagales bacterium]